jgi:hypothetical protein
MTYLYSDAISLQIALLGFLALCIGHALGDYPLQGRFLSIVKNRHADVSEFFPEGQSARYAWIHALVCHGFIHAGIVWLITGTAFFAVIEFFLHCLIDYLKCEGKTTFHTDQLLHYLCKVGYVICIYYGLS